MKIILSLICVIVLTACSNLQLTTQHNILLQTPDKQFSCYTGAIGGGSNCCYPYKNKLMICTYVDVNGIGNEQGSIVIRFVPENIDK